MALLVRHTVGRLGSLARPLSSSASDFVEASEISHGVLRVALNRPDLHNAFNDEVIAELNRLFQDEIPKQAHLRAVVLTGVGKNFSAGADLNWMRRMADYTHEENVRDALALFDMFHAIRTCPVPVLGRINGPAIGGGAGLVCCCDFAFALQSASFGFTEVKLGLVPAVISPFVVQKIGASFASRYFLTGERFAAAAAQRMSMIQDTFDNENDLDDAVTKTLAHIVQSSPQSVRASKKIIEKVTRADFHSLKQDLAAEIARLRVSPEGQHGLRSFLSKQTPNWSQFLQADGQVEQSYSD